MFNQDGPIRCRVQGGTIYRKCVTGSGDRMSYDLDVTVDRPEALVALYEALADVTEPPFSFRLVRGKEGSTHRAEVTDEVFRTHNQQVRRHSTATRRPRRRALRASTGASHDPCGDDRGTELQHR